MGSRIFKGEPTSATMIAFLASTFRKNGRPRHLITDHGPQFTAEEFDAWCQRRGVRQRFGAVGKYGSLAVIERLIRTIKAECTRRLGMVPFRIAAFQREMSLYLAWYNADRPHTRLRGCTPDECTSDDTLRTGCLASNPGWDGRRSRCAPPQVLVRGRPGAALELRVEFHCGRKHLPLVTLKRVA